MLYFEIIENQVVAVDEDDVVRVHFPYEPNKVSCITFVKQLAYFGVFGKSYYYPKKSYNGKSVPDYAKCAEAIGMSVSKARDKVTSLMIRVFMDNKKKYIYRLATKWQREYKEGKWAARGMKDPQAVELITERWDLIQEYEKDGLTHMVAFALLTGLSPAENKKWFGKKLWAKLQKNSMTRNDLLFKLIFESNEHRSPSSFHASTVRELNKYPSTILKHTLYAAPLVFLTNEEYCINSAQKFMKTIKGKKLKDIDMSRIGRLVYMVMDCRTMAQQLNEPFDPKWSFRRMMLEHDRLQKLEHAMKYSPEPFAWLEQMPQVIKDEDNGITAYLLNNARDIGNLGYEQQHCVGSYSGRVRHEKYIVYKVVKGDEVFTFGCTLRDSGAPFPKGGVTRYYDEMFLGFANKPPKEEAMIEFGKMLKKKVIWANEKRNQKYRNGEVKNVEDCEGMDRDSGDDDEIELGIFG
jgi:hypothetical protein